MKRKLAVALAVSILAVTGLGRVAVALSLGEAAELEAARANARAGGPVSARDKELLERHGCLSGTDNPVCRPWGYRDQEPARKRHRKYR